MIFLIEVVILLMCHSNIIIILVLKNFILFENKLFYFKLFLPFMYPIFFSPLQHPNPKKVTTTQLCQQQQ